MRERTMEWFSYFSNSVFIGSTNFLFLQLQLEGGSNPLFTRCNLKEAPTPSFFVSNQKEATTPFPWPVQLPKNINVYQYATTTSTCHCPCHWTNIPSLSMLSTCHHNLSLSTYHSNLWYCIWPSVCDQILAYLPQLKKQDNSIFINSYLSLTRLVLY